MTDTEVDTFLEHFGVKGMKWGIRNAPTGNTKDRQARAKEARKGALKAVAKKAIPVALITGGAAYVLWKMRGYGKTPVKTLPTYIPPTEQQMKVFNHEILKRNASTPLDKNPHLIKKASDIMEGRKEAQAAYAAYLKKRKV